MKKHTPGPWYHQLGDSRLYHGSERMLIMAAPDRAPIAKLSEFSDNYEANARLIAAAPELLAALQAVLEDLAISSERWADSDAGPATVSIAARASEELDLSVETQQQIRDAIAKATEPPK